MPGILVIDGSQDLLELFRLILEEEGFKVHLNAAIPENLADIALLHPDLIILDFSPGKYQQGWQFLQRVKRFDLTASIPLILCTVARREIHEQESYLTQFGIQTVFKPFEIDDLLHAIYQVVPTRHHC